MRFYKLIAASTAALLIASPVLAADPAQTAPAPAAEAPVPLQPTPLPPAVASTPTPPPVPTQAQATLGPEGLMFTRQRQGLSEAEAVAAIAPAAGTPNVNADKPPVTVGGAPMLPTQTIAANIVAPKNLTTLVKSLDTAGLSPTLANTGSITLFAPSNNAFNKLPKAAFNNLFKPQNKDKLVKLLNYHMVPGLHDAASIRADIVAGGGTATYQTLAGEAIRVSNAGNGAIMITDDNGNKSRIALADAYQSNGVVHVVDTVLIPQ